MTKYTLNANIDQGMVTTLNDSKYKLCVGVVTQGACPVVASATDITAKEALTWEDTYRMAATTKVLAKGDPVTATSAELDISFGQVYELPKTGDPTVTNDDNAPTNGFRFHNHVTASAILYQTFGGQSTAVYLSNRWVAGTASLTPSLKAMVWFEDASSGDVSTKDDSDKFEVDFTSTTTQTVKYDATGSWALST